jgi:methionyl-tRNA formyltransferase
MAFPHMTATAVVFGYHNVGARCLQVLLDRGVKVLLVVTHEDDPNEAIWFDSVAGLARQNGITVITPEDANTSDMIARLHQLAPDFLFSFYYRRMLSPDLLATARRGAYNMHGSLLPHFRGRAPVNWAIVKGATETGATLHEMVEKPDAGRIVDQQAVPIGSDDIAIEVFHKVTAAAVAVLARSLPGLIAGTAVLKKQDLTLGSYFSGRRPEDGRIDWLQGAKAIHDLVRAVAPPYPGAFTDFGGLHMRVLRTRIETERTARPGGPGLYCDGGALYADCADGKVLRLLETEGAPDAAILEDRKIPFENHGR